MLPIKGIKLMIISVLLASLLMPFTVFASTQNIIVPTYSSSSTESTWSSHLHVENYCEGTSASTNSCILKFTVDDNYYGMISFDAYNGNTMWINYQNVFIAGGYGEYHYNFWSNGQIVMNKVNINAVSLVLPDSNVDLTQIIQLLTAIESDTSSIDLLVNQTKTQIINVLNQLVISNGYLQLLTKLRQYHYPIESLSFISSLYNFNYDVVDNYTNQYWDYPIFNIPRTVESNLFYTTAGSSGQKFIFIFYSTLNISDNTLVNRYLSFDNATLETTEQLGIYQFPNGTVYRLVKLTYVINSSYVAKYFKYLGNYYNDVYFIPIYANNSMYNNISLDFALNYKLTNDLLNNINTIANGTTQSNSASSDLQSNTSDFQTSANQYYTIENTYNNNMNTQLQNIDTSTGLSGFGGNFLTSANWVRVQYQNLTNGNPFGSLVTYGLTLGLALLLLGKVFL